jgi:hypothetical protein
MGEYAKAEPLIQEALRKALALVAPSVRRAGVGGMLESAEHVESWSGRRPAPFGASLVPVPRLLP